MNRVALMGAALLCLSCGLLAGCSSEPAAKEGDAEVVKTAEKNDNPAAKSAREQQGVAGGGTPGTMEPPPGN